MNSSSNKQLFAGGAAIMLAALLWSLDGLFLRPQFYRLPAELVVFWEHFLGFIVLSPFLFVNWHKIKSLSRKSWGAIIWVSIFGGLIGTIMITKAFFAAMDGEVTFATVVILQKLQPFFALILARLILGEKLVPKFYFWAGVALVASYVLAFSDHGFSWQEINLSHNAAWFAILAAFAFGSSTVFGKRIANHLDYKAVAALRFLLTSILALILIVANGAWLQTAEIGSLGWRLLVIIVFTSGAAAMFLYYYGLRRVSASAATILELFWPLSALILDYIFHKNYLNATEIIAALVLLLAFYQISAWGGLRRIRFKAKVVRGMGRGNRLGYPTANLDKTDLDIPHGVYAVKLKVVGQEYSGLMHFGFKDVFREPVSLEVLIKDFSGDIYGEEIEVRILKKIREVKNFPGPELLIEEIKKDLTQI